MSLKEEVLVAQKKLPGSIPGLAIVQVGGRDDSNVYIRMKIRAAAEIGIVAEHVKLPKSTTEHELLSKVLDQVIEAWVHKFNFFTIFQLDALNNDPNVHGIIVQMPLDCDNPVDSDLVTDYVSPEKDVDGWVYCGFSA